MAKGEKNGVTAGAAFWISSANVLSVVVQTFGWPGTVLAFVGAFVLRYASDEQKRDIVDRYVLGRGISEIFPIIGVVILAALVVGAQSWSHKKTLALKDAEIKRIGDEKSQLQELMAKKTLAHRSGKK
jgi:hypothetical protein